MKLLTFEHGRFGYWADYVAYGLINAALAAALLRAPAGQGPTSVGLVAAGLVTWTLIEYALHRFFLHGMDPFRRLHTAHHEHPMALVATPTILSASMIALLVSLPVYALAGAWPAVAFTLGVTLGYFVYGLIHHATHHWRARGRWMRARKRCHAIHHRQHGAGNYGVTSSFWDWVFGSDGRRKSSASSPRGGRWGTSLRRILSLASGRD